MQQQKEEIPPGDNVPTWGYGAAPRCVQGAVLGPVTSEQPVSKGRPPQALRQKKNQTFQHFQHNREEVKNARMNQSGEQGWASPWTGHGDCHRAMRSDG